MAGRPFHRKLIKFVSDGTVTSHRGYRINVGKETKSGGYQDCYVDIMDKIIDHVESEKDRFNPLFVGRFDLVFDDRLDHPDISDQQEMMTSFLNSVKKYLSKKTVDKSLHLRNHKSVKIGWVREYGSEKQWHYHCYICLDGEKVSNWESGLFDVVDHHWERCSGLYYRTVHKNNPKSRKDKKNCWIIAPTERGREQLHHAIYALSYLAKCRDKRDSRKIANIATHSIPKIDMKAQQNEAFRNKVMNY